MNNTPQYQFNLGNPDPILSGNNYKAQDYFKDLDNEIYRLNELKQRMEQKQYSNKNNNLIWDEIDKEISALTDEQKTILSKDETYISIDRELQIIVQQELINSVKYKIENTSRGKELLENQLKNIRSKKKQIVEESNRKMELFEKFQMAVQMNPNLTYAEFIKTINQ